MGRWEALFAVIGVATLFLPIFVAVLLAPLVQREQRVAREKRIAAYRKSPESKLLILN